MTVSDVALYFSHNGVPVDDAAVVAGASASDTSAGGDVQRGAEWMHARGQAVCDEWLAVSDGPGASITVLLHGFANSVEDAHVSYGVFVAELSNVLSAAGQRTLVVPVFWDGTTSPTLGHWRRAQYTAPLVGVRLRAFINAFAACDRVGERPEIRLITHSSGAIIAASLVGDPSNTLRYARPSSRKYGKRPEYQWYVSHVASTAPADPYRVPHEITLDIGSLAPALAHEAICALDDGVCGQGAPAFRQWVFLVRPLDRVLNGIVGLSRRRGVGSLGARRGPDLLTEMQEHIERSGWECAVDFIAAPRSARRHGAVAYAQSEQFAALVRRLYVEAP